jgi:hypothetical protein
MTMDWEEFERLMARERTGEEHPELAYRRGVQQGAYFVLEALEADSDAIDRKLLADIRRYVGVALAHWRYCSRPRRLLRACNPPRVQRRKPPQRQMAEAMAACDDPDAEMLDDFARRGAHDDETPYE